MVEQIYDTNKFKEELKKHGDNTVSLHLTREDIQEWKDKGHFSHIKRELQNLPNIKFACIDERYQCTYVFMVSSLALANRIANMLIKMDNTNEHKSLVYYQNEKLDEDIGPYRHCSDRIMACSLF